jgi:hypothetical protein
MIGRGANGGCGKGVETGFFCRKRRKINMPAISRPSPMSTPHNTAIIVPRIDNKCQADALIVYLSSVNFLITIYRRNSIPR